MRKNFKIWHMHLHMSFFLCNFARWLRAEGNRKAHKRSEEIEKREKSKKEQAEGNF